MAGKGQDKPRKRGPGNPLSKTLLSIGRFLSPTKAKEPELWEIWTDSLTANGIRPSDRITELIAWDVQNNGQNLGSYDMLKREGTVQKKFNEMTEIESMANIAKQQITNNVNAEVEHQKQMSDMNAAFMQNMNQTQNMMAQFQQQIQELKQTNNKPKS